MFRETLSLSLSFVIKIRFRNTHVLDIHNVFRGRVCVFCPTAVKQFSFIALRVARNALRRHVISDAVCLARNRCQENSHLRLTWENRSLTRCER